MLRLRFPESRIRFWAARFPEGDDDAVLGAARAARARGWLTKPEFMLLGDWKTPRSRPRRAANAAAFVRATTRAAFAARDDAAKIEALLRLEGVGWPTASVLLHWCDGGRHPILDVRALWSVGVGPRITYTVALWEAYARFTRALARRNRVTMRQLDRALWQYAKERQP